MGPAVRQTIARWRPAAIRLNRADHLSMAHPGLVNEQHRLALLTIPKAGCTKLNKFMTRMAGASDWRANSQGKQDRSLLSRWNRRRAEAVLNDSE